MWNNFGIKLGSVSFGYSRVTKTTKTPQVRVHRLVFMQNFIRAFIGERKRVVRLLDVLQLICIHPDTSFGILIEKGGLLLFQGYICVFFPPPHFFGVCMDRIFGEKFL